MPTALPPDRTIVLIGLMGAGKTTVGRLVAGALGRPFVDTDAMVEAEAGRSIAAIFAGDGEVAFRRLEAAAVRRAAAVPGRVLAVGGGAVLDPGNVTHLREGGAVVWLDAPTAVLVRNLAAADQQAARPLLQDPDRLATTLEGLRRARHDAYAAAATVRIDVGGRPAAAVAEEVLTWVRTGHAASAHATSAQESPRAVNPPLVPEER